MSEAILDPTRPIIDPHHHLWDVRHLVAGTSSQCPWERVLRRTPRYLLDELLTDLNSGHNIRATVHVECDSMYRADRAKFACVGETEFINGVAAMGASGTYGDRRPCAGIVGFADLTMGSRVAAVLEAHIAAGGGRFCGVRQAATWDPNPNVGQRNPYGLYLDARFRAGFRCLAPLNLSFDAVLFEPQLPDLIDLARAFPETSICLNHVGMPLGISAYAGKRKERFNVWRANIEALAECRNVYVKLGGLGMHFAGFPSLMADPPASSTELAEEWRPYIETCIDAFSPSRAMFESNFPVDVLTCNYVTMWNAFKRLAKPLSTSEKQDVFYGAATRFYRLQLPRYLPQQLRKR
ncbi:amidohydrolase [Bradyrhizobium pachyrhizi]|uniref:amidohydrolase family protein n=1 Tax=Bradyrhizobium pachyrhizi TaxID=280333 RepID=UPI0007054CB0|nr:amidohydrolase family protein [Bradyrhizobium pachyrhizi]KRP91016.1 amidohydrolase [Bradyrhizobium pachyrhizi]